MISIIMPTHETWGEGIRVMTDAFNSIEKQTYKDYELVVSDQSVDHEIENFCNSWKDRINISYCREENKRGWFTANENNGIKHAKGDILKFLDADDFFYNDDSLEFIANSFDEDTYWLVTAYQHMTDENGKTEYTDVHYPTMNPRIHIVNTIGSQVGVAMRNIEPELFDDTIKWHGDCEWYRRIINRHGLPKFINTPTVVHRLWQGQFYHRTVDNAVVQREVDYLTKLYG